MTISNNRETTTLKMRKSALVLALIGLPLSVVLGGHQTATADISAGLVAYYPFNGNANDETPNAHDGTVDGATLTNDRFGHPMSAYRFDGVNDKILIGQEPNFPSWDTYAVSVWFLNNGGGDQGTGYGQKILSKAEFYTDFHLSVLGDNVVDDATGGLSWWSSQGGFDSVVDFSKDYRDNVWHHAVLNKKSASEGDLWVDGVLQARSNTLAAVVNSVNLVIGYTEHSDGFQQKYWSGKIDDIRIYNRVLSAAEISELFVGAPGSGDLDTSFSGDGKVLTNFGSGRDDVALALALQPDGKIVVAGYSDVSGSLDFALARYLSNGTLDPSFSGDGKVLTNFGTSDDVAYALALQPDGKIVVAGYSNASGSLDFALARYLSNGTLDPSFSGDGKVLTNFGGGNSDWASALAIQPRDGRLVVAGYSDASGSHAFALARYHAITCNGVVATRVGTAGHDILMGTNGPDVIVGFDGNDTIYGLGGNDLLCGNGGHDTLYGGAGDDTLIGETGTDVCDGGTQVQGDRASGCEHVTGVP